MIRFTCPACNASLHVPDSAAGKKGPCPKCGQRLLVPPPQRRNKTMLGITSPPPPIGVTVEETAEEEVSVAPLRDDYGDDYRPRPSRSSVKIPILVSAISNVIVGLVLASTCFGVVLTVPMAILCFFEFTLWGQADYLRLSVLGRRAKTLGIFEIIIGLFNTVSLICGIIVVISSSKLSDPDDYEY